MSGHVNHMSAPPAKLVIVGSKNPVKITAVKDAFEAVWPDGSFSFEGMDVPSGVGESTSRNLLLCNCRFQLSMHTPCACKRPRPHVPFVGVVVVDRIASARQGPLARQCFLT